ncbi:putative RNA-binding protein Luc7-like 1 [Cryptotermes secundus]|nr:putative RNA-binding protein Luc7-like 2 isoform X3 [Cryptotermes secundus]XP_023727402.1 putative RNA-binding protein Luc7-like 2 isoform X3 [Cryptotermes secundus]XP_023727403.1 putative RNA-binding protein Luc7-like 2 isoform X3 [Cryptotermes secundus]PNF40709.1 putative RNA-binding protein Luc7-like 1 [Cryptotermes secundus]PNF40711.1 putative RNA-binding protein Luc7-like 1 [Cryptotermes secundus]PNF40717.1 putative RNA-binding protein Luc7-like 1 [Cryptotermes secundus]
MDLGECPKIHDLALRADFEKASQSKDYYYDIDAMEHLQAFIADCDRRTELAKQRLAETQEELSAEVAQKANKVHELAEQIGKKLARAEQLGAEGFVEESMKLMEEIEDLRKKKSAAEGEYRNSMPASSYQQQKLRVCEVCSAYLGIHDNDRRLADHFGGKLHLGFIKIREKLSDLEKTVEGRKQQKRQEMSNRDREREREREDRERERVKDRERDRVGSSSNRDRGRDRDRDRSHRRSRSSSRGRSEKRSRSRSKSHSSRSRRSRSSSRSRRSRSHRSRSGDRRKDRSRSRDKKRDGRESSRSRRDSE